MKPEKRDNLAGVVGCLAVVALVVLLFGVILPLTILFLGNFLLEALNWDFRFDYWTALATTGLLFVVGLFFRR